MIKKPLDSHRGWRFLISVSMFLVLVCAFALSATAQSFPRCISGCTANDVELVDVSAELIGSGTPGESAQANLLVSLHFNRKKTYCVRFVADVYIDGELAVADLVSEPLNVFSKGDYPDLYFGTVSLPYGSALSLENVLVMWSVDKDFDDVVNCEDGSCEPYGSKSKCTGDQYGTISVILPLEAVDDGVTANEDEPITIDVLANDLLGLEPAEITHLTDGAHGATDINRNGTVTYTPERNFSGTDSFTYTLKDSAGNVASARVTVSIVFHNDAPTARNDSAQTNENEAVQIDVLANDSDSEGGLAPESIVVTKDPKNGTLSIDPISGSVTYTPTPRTCGNDNFEYTVEDVDGAVSDEAKVEIAVLCNEPPRVQDDEATTDEGLAVNINVLANDSDQDGLVVPSTVSISKQPKDGTVRLEPSTGVVTYTPDPGFCGDDYFKYTVEDEDGGTSDEAKVEIAVLCNEPPHVQDDKAITDENVAVNINVLANDSDAEGSINPSTLVITKDPKDGTASADPSTGVVTYTPDARTCGGDYFKYTVADETGAVSEEAKVEIEILCNEAPVAQDDQATTDENTSVGIHVTANDFDPDGSIDTATIQITKQPKDGSVSVHPTSGVITYTPNTGQCEEDSFKYVMEDDDGRESNEATVVVEILCDDPPLAIDDLYSIGEGQTLVTPPPGVLNNDIVSPTHPLSAFLESNVTHGTLSLNQDGSFTYIHDGSETTSDEFIYFTRSGTRESNLATVMIVIQPGNDTPTAINDAGSTQEDTPITLSVLDNDSDPDGDVLAVDWVGAPQHGSVANNGRTLTYTPDPNYHGIDTFDYAATDGNGGQAQATVTISVSPLNDPPVAQDDSESALEDTPVTIDVLDNDSDPDGDSLSVQSVAQPSHGTSMIQGSAVVYSPNLNFHGTDTFSYTLTDGQGGTSTAWVTVAVAEVNDPPSARDDFETTEEDASVEVDVLSNDSDPDGDSLSVESVSQPAHGTAAYTATGVTYTPDPNFNGEDTFTYTTRDGNGGTATATVTITVIPSNDPPVAQDDHSSTPEDVAVTIEVLINDFDLDGDALTLQSATQPNSGTVTVQNGQIVYTPDLDFNGTDTFTYTISDASSSTATAEVSVTVIARNDAPIAEGDEAFTEEETPVFVDVLSNDSDPDGDALSIEGVTQPGYGTIEIVGDSLRYVPALNFAGTDSLSYSVADGHGGVDTATVIVHVSPVNDLPLAQDDSATTQEDTLVTIPVIANDSDPDGDFLLVESTTSASNGTVINAENSVSYIPNPGFNGIDSFTYTISDSNGGTATASVQVAVLAVNDPPVALDDAQTTDEDTPVEIDVLANDSDPDGDDLILQSLGQPEHGSVAKVGNFVRYTPDPQFHGIDRFTYVVSDGNGETATAIATITVAPINDLPVAQADSESTLEDTPVTVDVLGNDSDPDGDNLIVQSVTQPSHGSVVNNGQDVTYTPDAQFNGVDSFTYIVSDGQGGTATATVTIAVAAVNDPPVAVDDSRATDEDTPVEIDVLANDSDPDGDVLIIQSLTQPAHGSAVKSGDLVIYSPAPQFNGVDSFTYAVSDGNGGSATATVTLQVVAVNDSPVAQDDSGSTDEGTPVTVDVLDNDSDPDGDNLIVQSVTQPSHGSVVNNGQNVVYTPNAQFNGVDSFTYIVSDGQGGTATATVTLAVAAVNDPPVAVDDSRATDEDTPVEIDVLANDSDPDADVLIIQSLTQPAHGSAVKNGDLVIYSPAPQFNGVDSFTYAVSDGNGGSATATVTIQVAAVNDSPVAQDDSGSTDEGTPVTVDVLNNDSDPDGDDLIVESVTQPANGSVVNNGQNVVYTPNAQFNGVDSFTYIVSDGQGGTATATVTLAVAAVNDPPVAVDDSRATDEDTPVEIEVLANDSDPDADVLIIQSLTQPAHGSAVKRGDLVIYSPAPQFNGVDSFAYAVSDGNGGSATATVTIQVAAVNDSPVAQDDSGSTDEGTPVTVDVLNNDSDPDGDDLIVESVTQPANGSVVNNGQNVVYTPNAQFNGVDSFTYIVSDGQGGTATATVTLAVAAVNDPPVAVDDSRATDEDTPVEIEVLANDSDPDADVLIIQSLTQPAHGSAVKSGDLVIYSPAPQFNGVDSFTYAVSDGNGGTASATVTIAVTEVNDLPTAQNDSDSTDEGNLTIIDVLANDFDPDGDDLIVVSVTQGAHGVVVNNSVDVAYTPNPDFSGVDSFTYTLSDGHGGISTATVTVAVSAVNDPPLALDDAGATDEGVPVTLDVLANDSDPEGNDLTIQSLTQPLNGSVVINANQLVYSPKALFNGTDTFTYTITDGQGETATATVSVLVNAVNDPPVAQDDSGSTIEATPVTINVLVNDSDPDGDSLTIQSSTQPSHGSVAISESSMVYTPAPAFSGIDTFSYTITDGQGETATAEVTIAVTAVNDPPSAVDDSVTTGEDLSITVLVLPNDFDPEGDLITILSVTQPLHGTVVSNTTSIIYTPSPNYIGNDSFTYTITDSHGGRSTASVDVVVLAINDAPNAQDDSQITQENVPVTILVLSNDSDPDGDSLIVESSQQPAHGRITNTGTALFYEPNPGFSGTDSFVYTIADQHGGTDTARVTIVVSALNDPPVAQNDSAETDEDVLVIIPILANDFDSDGDFLLIESFTQPANGTVINSRTNLSYIPNPGFQGVDTFTYTVSDGNGGSSQATVTVSVAGTNDAPFAQDDSAITDEGDPTTILTLLNDSDPDGDPLSIESVTSPDHGIVEVINEQLVYTPDPTFDGVDSFTYTISDGRGGTSTATVFVAVAAQNDAPMAQDDSITTIEEESVSVPVLANDSDPDGDALAIVSLTQPSNGSVSIVNNEIVYVPAAGFTGTDLFSYTISDDSGSTSSATVTVGVDPLIAGAGAAANDAASCEGRVIISEIAWAGTAADAQDEWIELRNLGTTPVDLTGWALRWRSSLPATPQDQVWKVIALEGTLPGARTAACEAVSPSQGISVLRIDETTWSVSASAPAEETGYYLLERRSDGTVQGIEANQLYGINPSTTLRLSDSGEIVMLLNAYEEVVDTANASNLGRNGWVAGSATTKGSMERIDPLKPDTAENWQTNFGLVIAGDDSAGHPLRATPGLTNSPDLERIESLVAVPSASVRAGEILQADFALTRQDRRIAGWPWISVVRPGFTGISGAGGAADYSAYAFSGSYQTNDQYALEIGTAGLGTGSYSFWIIYGSGQAIYAPVIVSP